MSDSVTLMALFDEVESVAEVHDALRRRGMAEEDMIVLSGMPYSPEMLGRSVAWGRLPVISISGACVGFLIGIFLNVGTPLLYSVRVGGQPLIPIPTSAVLTYEFTMMGLIVSTFLGVLWQSTFPDFGPKHYHPLVTNGRVGLLFACARDEVDEIQALMQAHGAEQVVEPEERIL